MNAYTVVFLVLAVALAECGHTFMGSSVQRPLVFHKVAKRSSNILEDRIEYLNFTMPAVRGNAKSIRGILAYDVIHSGASADVTAGGLGYNFVILRIISEFAKESHYDIYIYA